MRKIEDDQKAKNPFQTVLKEYEDYKCFIDSLTPLVKQDEHGESYTRMQENFIVESTMNEEKPQYIKTWVSNKIKPKDSIVKGRNEVQLQKLDKALSGAITSSKFVGFILDTKEEMAELWEVVKNIPIVISTDAHTKTDTSLYPNVAAMKPSKNGDGKKAPGF